MSLAGIHAVIARSDWLSINFSIFIERPWGVLSNAVVCVWNLYEF